MVFSAILRGMPERSVASPMISPMVQAAVADEPVEHPGDLRLDAVVLPVGIVGHGVVAELVGLPPGGDLVERLRVSLTPGAGFLRGC